MRVEKVAGCIAALFALGATVPSAAADTSVIFVSHAATGANNGSSWVDAYVDLQDALEEARERGADETVEVWIAAGLYRPDRGTLDPNATFTITGNIAIYGGFAGTETSREQRDPVTNETILDGDLLENDDFFEVGDNPCCHENLDGCPDAACHASTSLISRFCEHPEEIGWTKSCAGAARALCCDLCRPSRCDNSRRVVSILGSQTVALIDGLTISGAEHATDLNEVDLVGYGGGLFSEDAAVHLRDCVFTRNAAWGGAAAYIDWGTWTFERLRVVENISHFAGYVVLASTLGAGTVSDCEFLDNSNGGLYSSGGADVRRCRFEGNTLGGALALHGGAPTVRDCVFVGNHSEYGAGALSVAGFSAQVINCKFLGNRSGNDGGAVYTGSLGATVIVNCLFSGNHAGGGILFPRDEPLSGVGGAVYGAAGATYLLNCTVVNNEADSYGGLAVGRGDRVENCILWGNRDVTGTGEHAQFTSSTSEPASFRYSLIAGWTGTLPGEGVFDDWPRFVDANGPDSYIGTEDDDLRLQSHSPTIDAGDPNPPLAPFSDFDGHPRILCGRLDLGAYEFGIGDYDCDREVTTDDSGAWPQCCDGPLEGVIGPHRGDYQNGCEAYDFNADADIDLEDFSRLSNLFDIP